MASVLILEDSAPLRRLLEFSLTEAGHCVTVSETGEMAFDEEALASVDVLITDINMPWVNGLEAILHAKTARPELAIIAMSGGCEFIDTDYLEVARKFGAMDVLHKPFEPKNMIDTVERALAA